MAPRCEDVVRTDEGLDVVSPRTASRSNVEIIRIYSVLQHARTYVNRYQVL